MGTSTIRAQLLIIIKRRDKSLCECSILMAIEPNITDIFHKGLSDFMRGGALISGRKYGSSICIIH